MNFRCKWNYDDGLNINEQFCYFKDIRIVTLYTFISDIGCFYDVILTGIKENAGEDYRKETEKDLAKYYNQVRKVLGLEKMKKSEIIDKITNKLKEFGWR